MGVSINPVFSWSTSRQETFDNCPKRYYFHYYETWQAWPSLGNRSHLERARKAYSLKNTSNIPIWKGNLVHQAVGMLLEGMVVEKILGFSQRCAERGWKNSKDNARWKIDASPKKFLLAEHLEQGPDDNDLISVISGIEECVRAVNDSLIPEQFSDAREEGRFTFVETELKSDTEKFRTMKIELPIDDSSSHREIVWTMLDAALEKTAGSFEILDWKMGRAQEEVDNQKLRTYALWLHENYSGRIERIDAHFVYLPDMVLRGGRINEGQRLAAKVEVSTKMKALYTLHTKACEIWDLEKAEELFEPKPEVSKCRNCKFNSICDQAVLEV